MIRRILLFLPPFCIYAIPLLLPTPAWLGLFFRYDLIFAIPLLLALFFIALRLPHEWGRAAALGMTLLAFALPLAGAWASGVSELNLLGGLIPWKDAVTYYMDANRALRGELFSAFAARRPLFSGFLSLLLALTGQNLQAALAALTAMVAVSCFLLARQVQRTHGALAAAFVLAFLFLYSRRFIGVTLTENLGLILGCLGLALLWQGAGERRRFLALAGIFLITLALNARAGALLVLPALALWLGWFWRGRQKYSFVSLGWAAAAIGLGFALNLLVFRLLANPTDLPFSNFSYTLYGLAHGGKGWEQALIDHPDLAGIPDSDQSRLIYGWAWEEIRKNPGGLAQGALRAWLEFLSIRNRGVFGFVSGGDLLVFGSTSAWRLALYVAGRGLLFLLSLAGVWGWLRNRQDAHFTLIAAVTAGTLLSVPYAPPIDASVMRVYAATLPMLAALPALGMAHLLKQSKRLAPLAEGERTASTTASLLFGLGLAAALILGPPIVRAAAQRPPAHLVEIDCPPGQEALYIQAKPGSFISVVDDESIPQSWLPRLGKSDYRLSVQNFKYYELEAGRLLTPSIPLSIAVTYNRKDGKDTILIVESDLSLLPGKYLGFCGVRDDVYFYSQGRPEVFSP